jgi:hypothetical protein
MHWRRRLAELTAAGGLLTTGCPFAVNGAHDPCSTAPLGQACQAEQLLDCKVNTENVDSCNWDRINGNPFHYANVDECGTVTPVCCAQLADAGFPSFACGTADGGTPDAGDGG